LLGWFALDFETKHLALDIPLVFGSLIDQFPVLLLAANLQGSTLLFVLLIILLVLIFFVSGAEAALFSLGSKEVNLLKTKHHSAAKRITDLLEEPKELYASLLIAGTFISICIIVLSNFLIERHVSLERFPFWLATLSKALFIAFILVFFGRLLPKVWATQNNLRVAYDTSFAAEMFHLLLRRLSRWIVTLADGIGRRLGADRSNSMSIRELDEAIDFKSDEEASPEEKNIMKGIVKFGNISVKQIMRSRLDVSGIEFRSSFGDLVKKVEDLHYSRLPVYKESLDNVVGLVTTKDLLQFLDEADDFDWHGIMRPPYFVPETKLIEDLLRDFQQKKIHFAVVVDEFGGTQGIVTMEDILEEVIGDIKDEFDEEESSNRRLDEYNYVFEGKTMLHDMCKTMRLPMDTFDRLRGESESLGGLILELAGEFPAENAVISINDFEFNILQTDNNRIQQVKVTVKPKNK
jgi:putative hemolysin